LGKKQGNKRRILVRKRQKLNDLAAFSQVQGAGKEQVDSRQRAGKVQEKHGMYDRCEFGQ
jgi:hypothetical protein